MDVVLEFKSPFLVCGKKTSNNFIESIDYIPGSVVRAAFAKFIVYNCPCSDDFHDKELGRYYWVRFKDTDQCKKCKYSNICKNFDKIRFSFFYPKGARPNPFSNMICKNYEDHGFQDVLLAQKDSFGCPKCPKSNNRLERYSGLVKEGKPYKVKKKGFTKTAVNLYTRTVLQGSLYSLVTVAKTGEEGLVFEGKIEGVAKEDLEKIDEIRIGKYNSVGFGIAKVVCRDEKIREGKEKVIDKLKQFSNEYKKVKNLNDNRNYIALYFTSNVLFRADCKEEYRQTEEYATILRESLHIPREFEIEEVFSNFGMFRGFDTSFAEPKRKELFYLAPAGTVLVLRTFLNVDTAYNILSKIEGFGEYCHDGYGEFEFYFGGLV